MASKSLKVLAFEDSYDILALLEAGGVDTSEITLIQRWDTTDAIYHVQNNAPDILLLDHFIPPATGLEVLRAVIEEVCVGSLVRPKFIIAISTMRTANERMVMEGADGGFIKYRIGDWKGWPRKEANHS